MRRPTAVEIGLAASLVLLLVGVWLRRADPALPPITAVQVLPARTGPEP